MPVIAVVNPKGGVGKSTVATNLAGYFAATDHSVMLGDLDSQQSSRNWLGFRPDSAPMIDTWEMNGRAARPPKGVTHVVIDTPAQFPVARLAKMMRGIDKVLVPMQPSIFDIHATADFLRELKVAMNDDQRFRDTVAIVGVRVDPRTRAAEELSRFLAEMDLTVAGYLRDTQAYVQLAAQGLTLFDSTSMQDTRDLETWKPLIDWVVH